MQAEIHVPHHINELMHEPTTTLAISISGGKDSQAMLQVLCDEYVMRDWQATILAVHADLGRAEWHQTPELVERQAEAAGIPLMVVRRADGLDLPALIERRAKQLEGTGRPFWPSSAARYCTSDMKRAPIDKLLRTFSGTVISAEGVRAEESRARAAKPCWEPRGGGRLDLKDGTRNVIDWRPIHHWTEDDVWQALGGRTGELVHPAYSMGNQRLSCSLCVLASRGDLENGARENPECFELYLELEQAYGFTFKNNFSLSDLDAAKEAR